MLKLTVVIDGENRVYEETALQLQGINLDLPAEEILAKLESWLQEENKSLKENGAFLYKVSKDAGQETIVVYPNSEAAAEEGFEKFVAEI
jgi:hypothetical protein